MLGDLVLFDNTKVKVFGIDKNKKLRLLVTSKCPHKCPMCCNNQFNLLDLPVVDRLDYNEVMITGGEPLLFPTRVTQLVNGMRHLCGATTKFYVYTSIPKALIFLHVLEAVDGIVLTPHDKNAVMSFIELNGYLLAKPELTYNKSLRLNLFADIREQLPASIDLSHWNVKDMEWIKDCPVPEGEDFRRLPNLFQHN